ncbi:transcriptional regulator, TetR family [Streptoalloteichus tenebrarius]|uniref:Transcriptional regulator, TetR family n=1 Tax=Streptoalloteichus tenebrarius (strain ATCC 17920 / DSM 40477 / JCM 4838 / CBS 697.72 / NBRC 16177 / NCIMB 11028 / NRRL B-12390 / A12253. 1 / ISP 5477) TaxID=1933 RepID=A0ABT1I246_STRSD|nr:TetR/AcrR family transcriptional regulator [Streptoalloteichus tenebrarius]MCP2261803.1 transcriptional regulator, TetR family [Streptoalloteichus tenebrarius]
MRSEQGDRPARAKRLPRAVRERQILDAATAVFSQRGYHAASMDEVADVAGISKPMVYAYLGSKEELFAVCIKREAGRLVDAVGAVVDPELAPEEQLWRGVLAFFTFVGEYRDSWNVLHRQAGSEGQPFAVEIAEGRRRAITLIGALLAQAAVAEGVPEWFLGETEAMAAALVGAGESLADWWLDHPDESPRAMAARLMNLAWMGFGNLVNGRTWQPPTTPKADAAPA